MNAVSQVPECDAPAEISLWDRRLAAPMFVLTLLYLGCAGLAMHLLEETDAHNAAFIRAAAWSLLGMHLLFVIEAAIHWASGSRRYGALCLSCLFPPTRLALRDHGQGTHVWLPGLGWRAANPDLAESLDQKLGVPMIGIALLILPLLGIEHFYADSIQAGSSLGMMTRVATSFIWLAFAAEFLVMISLVDQRLKYVRQHWLDLAIICLPLIAFARALRITRLTRLSRLSRTARVFRLRGVAMRAWRAILLLQVVDRFLNRDPEKRLRLLQKALRDKQREVRELQAEILAQQERLSEQRAESVSSLSISDTPHLQSVAGDVGTNKG